MTLSDLMPPSYTVPGLLNRDAERKGCQQNIAQNGD